MHDYLTGRETFAWQTGDRPAPLSVAVNFTAGPRSGPPVLDLVFDNSGHGTHVAGIASGSGMYRLPGFDGVAPGAAMLSLKIANDARGGITRTGSIIAAMDYAVRFAAARRLPLVINLSYGVGNETEGRVRIDALVDSLLAAHPDVVMTVSAGNDGPGLSTIGFPASARRPTTVGATYPGAFGPPRPDGSRLDDQVADLIPTDGIVRDTAREIVKGARSDVDKARAIYEWVVENTFRDPKTKGCGWGDIKAMLESRNLGGKCGDLNALFVGLTRAAGVPARDIYGIRVAPSIHGYRSLGVGAPNITRAQHCRAEFFA